MPWVNRERRNSDLTRKVERKQKQIWGKKIQDGELYDVNSKRRYASFTAKWYLKQGILDSNVVTGLRKGKKMLSVGVGPGILEKTLLALSVPPENIDVTDITLHPEIQKAPFRKFEFDLTEEWPNFGRKYDYILFPESLCFEKLYRVSEEENEEYLKYLRENKKDTSLRTFRAELVLEIIKNAAKNLNPDGQIRIAGLFLRAPELKFVLSELAKMFPDMRPKILQFNESIPNCYLILQFFHIPVIRRKTAKR